MELLHPLGFHQIYLFEKYSNWIGIYETIQMSIKKCLLLKRNRDFKLYYCAYISRTDVLPSDAPRVLFRIPLLLYSCAYP